jgi:hypothetical protein
MLALEGAVRHKRQHSAFFDEPSWECLPECGMGKRANFQAPSPSYLSYPPAAQLPVSRYWVDDPNFLHQHNKQRFQRSHKIHAPVPGASEMSKLSMKNKHRGSQQQKHVFNVYRSRSFDTESSSQMAIRTEAQNTTGYSTASTTGGSYDHEQLEAIWELRFKKRASVTVDLPSTIEGSIQSFQSQQSVEIIENHNHSYHSPNQCTAESTPTPCKSVSEMPCVELIHEIVEPEMKLQARDANACLLKLKKLAGLVTDLQDDPETPYKKSRCPALTKRHYSSEALQRTESDRVSKA